MDFQFTRYLGSVIARCSMQHEAAANWINVEVRSNPALIITVLQHISHLRQTHSSEEITVIGSEYSLFINDNEVMVKANHLAMDNNEELEDDFHYYDAESIAFCGLDDFEHFLLAYQNF